MDCPSWKVFNAKVSITSTSATSIGYCLFLPYPPLTQESLERHCSCVSKLGMEHTVVTQDEAIYEISYTLRKNAPDDFPHLVLRLGGFHLLMNYLGAVGKVMADSGLKELLVGSGIVLEGTANKILTGKGYYQAINAHMRAHEALLYLWWCTFEDFCIENELDPASFVELYELIGLMEEALKSDRDNVTEVLEQMQACVKKMRRLMNRFNTSREEYKTHQFWLQYIEMIDTIMLYMHAEREGVWSEHLSAASSMTSVITAADHHKYTKVLVTYLEEMRSLPEQAPEIEEEFQLGHFTVKRAAGNFNAIWTDMALECSQNCDAKRRSGQAGLKGVTLKEKTQEKWFVTLPFSAAVASSLKCMLKIDNAEITHHEDTVAKHKKETDQRDSIVEKVNTEMINPFTFHESKEIVNIDNGLKATSIVATDLLGLREKGTAAIQHYLQTGKLEKVKLQTFAELDKVQKTVTKLKKYKNEMTDELQVMKRALVERERDSEISIKLNEILCHELRRYPPSLSEMDPDTTDIFLRGGNKAILLEVFKTWGRIENWDRNVPQSGEGTKECVVIDAMAVIRMNKPTENETSEQFARRILRNIMKLYTYTEVHIAAD